VKEASKQDHGRWPRVDVECDEGGARAGTRIAVPVVEPKQGSVTEAYEVAPVVGQRSDGDGGSVFGVHAVIEGDRLVPAEVHERSELSPRAADEDARSHRIVAFGPSNFDGEGQRDAHEVAAKDPFELRFGNGKAMDYAVFDFVQSAFLRVQS